MARRLGVLLVGVALLGALLAVSAASGSKLPQTHNKTIVPLVSVGGVRLGMTETKVFALWGGAPDCTRTAATSLTFASDACGWGARFVAVTHGQVAQASFVDFGHGPKVVTVGIVARTRKSNGAILPGKLNQWKTSRGIHLGSKLAAVKTAYPGATPAPGGPSVGWVIQRGSGSKLRSTNFYAGTGRSARRVASIGLARPACVAFVAGC